MDGSEEAGVDRTQGTDMHDAETEPDWDAVVFQDENVDATLTARAEVIDKQLGRQGVADELKAALSQYLPAKDPGDSDMPELVRDTLDNYFGQDVAGLIFWLARDDGTFADRIELASTYLSSSTIAALRLLFSTYGKDLQQCYRLVQNSPNDWRNISWQVWYNQGSERHEIRFYLDKENNERIRLECPPGSVLTLARILMDSLVVVPNVDEYLGEDPIARFRASVNALYEVLAKKTDEEVP